MKLCVKCKCVLKKTELKNIYKCILCKSTVEFKDG